MKRQAGFTLIEMMIAIAILAIVLGLGVSSFQEAIRTNRAATATNDLVAALQFARSEAIKRRQGVRVCDRIPSAAQCMAVPGANFASGGWAAEVGGTVIRVWDPPSGNATITGPTGGVTFQSTGRATAGTFFVQLPGCKNDERRRVEVLGTGRVNTSRVNCV